VATCTIGALNFVVRGGIFFFDGTFACGVGVATFATFYCRVAIGGGVAPLLASVALYNLGFPFEFFPPNNYAVNCPGFCLEVS
jgi:hypothetical protein